MTLVSTVFDAVVLLAAGVLLLHRGAPTLPRTLASVGAFVVALTGAFVAGALSLPAWTQMLAMITTMAAFCAAAVIVLVYPLPRLDLDGDDDGDGGFGDRRRRFPHAPWNGGGGEFEPHWWPTFERDFEIYARDRSGSPTTRR